MTPPAGAKLTADDYFAPAGKFRVIVAHKERPSWIHDDFPTKPDAVAAAKALSIPGEVFPAVFDDHRRCVHNAGRAGVPPRGVFTAVTKLVGLALEEGRGARSRKGQS